MSKYNKPNDFIYTNADNNDRNDNDNNNNEIREIRIIEENKEENENEIENKNENKENLISPMNESPKINPILNNQENNFSQSDINIEQNNIKEKDFTFLDQSQLENLINNSEKFKELLNFISEKNTNADDLYRNYLNELNENNYLNLEEEKINLKADIKNLEKIYEEESKSEYFVDKSKIRFAFKSFILSQINILDLENLVVKFRNNFNLEISSQIELNEENKYENENENENKMKKEKEIENISDKNEELKLRIENIIRDEKNYNDIKNDYNNSESNSNIKKIFNIDEHIEFGNKKAEDFVNRRKSKISKPNEKFQWTMKKIEENSDLDINMLLDYFKTIN